MPAWTWSVAVLAGFALSSRAQTTEASPPQAPESPARPTVRLVPRTAGKREQASQVSHQIVLNVLVTDASGEPISGLTERDFTTLEHGAPQKVIFFRLAQPAHVILVLDAVNSSHWSFAAERKAVETYLARRHTPLALPTAIAWLTESGIRVQPESRDRGALLGELQDAPRLRPMAAPGKVPEQNIGGVGATGGSILPSDLRVSRIDPGGNEENQRFGISMKALSRFALREQNAPGRIFVVWVGPGWPLLTGPGFQPDTPEIQAGDFDRIADLSNELSDAQIILNSVASPEILQDAHLPEDYYASLLTPVTAPGEASASHLALPVLAIHSGGLVLDQNKDLASEIAECLSHAGSGYMLSFESRPSSVPDRYRALEVKVDRPGVTVRTTTGYYAQP